MKKLRKVLVLGAGALKIGQAGEFDYSGSQALKALREEGISTILVNPNIATIQTSKELADQIYFLPVTPFFVERIIEKERPDGILLSFGGQTALNCGVELFKSGVLEKYQVEILGTPVTAIILTEDRQEFAEHLHKINIPTPISKSAESLEEAQEIAQTIGFPVMLRAGFALGGQGSGIAHNMEELRRIVTSALAFSPQVLVEQYLHHYKEVEYEVVRDAYDNCITVCNMENMDPLGIHTGESVVLAPSQTLTNSEYHTLRSAAIAIVRSLGIVGECNVQFALNPRTSEYYVIEVNARLSRSSALASKATGYPLAYVAAKLALGYALPELTNKVTGVTQACFEPSLDYVVVKIPRWDLDKFKGADQTIGTSMKSVGEVMGIGRTFEEAYQKAIRMLDLGLEGATSKRVFLGEESEAAIIDKYLYTPTPKRIFALPVAMRNGFSIEKISDITGIDPWFLYRIQHIVKLEEELERDHELTAARLLLLKQAGLSDKRIGELTGKTELEIRALRQRYGVLPSVFQIDTLAGEFPSDTNYLYMTYNGQHHDVEPLGQEGVVVLGSGPYRIGSSVEFDWSSVNTVQALKKYDKRSIVINCNPETVSTDYDMSDRLYFEELTFERIADICDFEDPYGVIVSVGGQTPNNRVKALHDYGIPILGTSAGHIDQAENRSKFSQLLDELGIRQPAWDTFETIEDILSFAERVGYPVLVRPSYVLSGSAMNVCYTPEQLERYTRYAAAVSPDHPVTVTKFFQKVKEVELDAVAQRGEIKAFVISEHVENAGVHSGDATIVLPPQTINAETLQRIEEAGRAIARALEITGPFNVQFLAKDNQVYVIEANLRASRTFPFISKVTGINLIELFVDALFQKEIAPVTMPSLTFTAVKAPQFSFSRLTGADPLLRVEMASTGEVACFGEDLEEAYLKAVIATGGHIPQKGILISIGSEEKKQKFLETARLLASLGLPLYATEKTCAFLRQHGIEAEMLFKIHEQREPNVLSYFRERKIDLAINVVDNYVMKEVDDNYTIRRAAVDYNIPLLTKVKQVRLFARAIVNKDLRTIPIKAWNEY
ncbi:carbamoyl-phosphate synthase (glutamine-hydrolyzing) large subunit [Thermogemmatispora tikiterensis]|uniref:Carbamoyl phosphate synthase arginine-specific large chain n=1 Tax=Thermogemmatispora tikiterensis TaxID=1825093 RepID=A0A328VGV9_9CHLR|nr:carbamoyl-phosphate synthase (glutamine-hydrolyzing) large subunit [Thermogemmatispora tikiterensis]RAQ96229.1 carbamoyl phosphate synthase large subunit [Thermogemmatispora tikiterensis]